MNNIFSKVLADDEVAELDGASDDVDVTADIQSADIGRTAERQIGSRDGSADGDVLVEDRVAADGQVVVHVHVSRRERIGEDGRPRRRRAPERERPGRRHEVGAHPVHTHPQLVRIGEFRDVRFLDPQFAPRRAFAAQIVDIRDGDDVRRRIGQIELDVAIGDEITELDKEVASDRDVRRRELVGLHFLRIYALPPFLNGSEARGHIRRREQVVAEGEALRVGCDRLSRNLDGRPDRGRRSRNVTTDGQISEDVPTAGHGEARDRGRRSRHTASDRGVAANSQISEDVPATGHDEARDRGRRSRRLANVQLGPRLSGASDRVRRVVARQDVRADVRKVQVHIARLDDRDQVLLEIGIDHEPTDVNRSADADVVAHAHVARAQLAGVQRRKVALQPRFQHRPHHVRVRVGRDHVAFHRRQIELHRIPARVEQLSVQNDVAAHGHIAARVDVVRDDGPPRLGHAADVERARVDRQDVGFDGGEIEVIVRVPARVEQVGNLNLVDVQLPPGAAGRAEVVRDVFRGDQRLSDVSEIERDVPLSSDQISRYLDVAVKGDGVAVEQHLLLAVDRHAHHAGVDVGQEKARAPRVVEGERRRGRTAREMVATRISTFTHRPERQSVLLL